MYKYIHAAISRLYFIQVTSVGIGIFRFLFGLLMMCEIIFLIYFRHLIFDSTPYLDVEYPLIGFFLLLWLVVAGFVCVGYRCQQAIIANWIFWLIFTNFTPMQRDFAGGFDAFMIGVNFVAIFMPLDKSFAVDGLRQKLLSPSKPSLQHDKPQVSVLAYTIPVTLCLGFLYFDSAVHKLFAEHWRAGLGAWLPASMPYYISAVDVSWFLDAELLQKVIGYGLLLFQFSFVLLLHNRYLRPLFFVLGVGFHLGITVVLNIYPFGVGVLILYCLVMPFSWYRKIASLIVAKTPTLLVFYDELCPVCCRTVLLLNHFDICRAIDFKGVQSNAAHEPALNKLDTATLLQDLYALDKNNNLSAGIATYANILIKMRYLALFGYLLKLPPIKQLANNYYRKIADNRTRTTCNDHCLAAPSNSNAYSLFDNFFAITGNNSSKISKIFWLFVLLQINSSVHYGLAYRLDLLKDPPAIALPLISISNKLLLLSTNFVGITPHALYLHDHLANYERIIAISYQSGGGEEKWLPLVDQTGRMLAPNWGRVQAMWANIAVTPNIDRNRLDKFIMKTSTFWGTKLGLDLQTTVFKIKLKKVNTPSYWVEGLLASNLTGDWQTIGTGKWRKKSFLLDLPANINLL